MCIRDSFATHQALPVLQAILGTGRAFNADGYYLDGNHTTAVGGQLAAVRGTELGSRRERALIAYDTNVNFQAFVTPGCEFALVWKTASPHLEKLGLRCEVMVPQKQYRIYPNTALAFNKWTECCRAARQEQPKMSPSSICTAAHLAYVCLLYTSPSPRDRG